MSQSTKIVVESLVVHIGAPAHPAPVSNAADIKVVAHDVVESSRNLVNEHFDSLPLQLQVSFRKLEQMVS